MFNCNIVQVVFFVYIKQNVDLQYVFNVQEGFLGQGQKRLLVGIMVVDKCLVNLQQYNFYEQVSCGEMDVVYCFKLKLFVGFCIGYDCWWIGNYKVCCC